MTLITFSEENTRAQAAAGKMIRASGIGGVYS